MYKKLAIVLIAVFFITWLMVDFLTLVGVVVAIVVPIVLSIVALIIVVWQELGKQTNKYVQTTNKLDELSAFLRTITTAQIHEKIAVLYDYFI
jgi:hypothetical protein